MSRTARVVAVVAATLVGAALTALLFVVPKADVGRATASAAASLATHATPPAPAPEVFPPTSNAPASAPPAPAGEAAAPTRLVLARLGIDMAVEPQGVDEHGQMGLPPDPQVAGWYRFGSAPRDAAGAVVVAAHVDSKAFGIGPFVRLGSARPGDEVVVWAGEGAQASTVTYRVSEVDRVDKAQLHGDDLFSLAGPARLHLVTCTGSYIPGSGYVQNLVVVADRVPS